MTDSLKKFINGLPPEHRKSNVYHIICQDKDGNITDEKFGLNILTNSGFNLEIRRVNSTGVSGYKAFFVGNGTGTPTVSNDQLFAPIGMNAKGNRVGVFSYAVDSSDPNAGDEHLVTYDLHNTYDTETNMLIGRRLCEQVTLEYNYSWWDTDIDITEFGVGYFMGYPESWWDPLTHEYHLNTHCLVYDENHDPSYFTKHLNEQITINMYRTSCIKCDLFATLWSEGKYLFVNPAYLVHGMFQDWTSSAQGYSWHGHTWHPPFELSIVSGRCLNAKDFPLYPVGLPNNSNTNYYDFGSSLDKGFGVDSRAWFACCTWSATQNGVAGCAGRIFNTQHENGWRDNMNWDNSCNNPSSRPNKIENTDRNNGKYGMTICHSDAINKNGIRTTCQIFWYEYNNQETPEELIHYCAFTDDFMTPNFRNIFGLGAVIPNYKKFQETQIPVNDFHITDCKSYNYLTDDWDIDEQFIDDPTADFRNPDCALCGEMMLDEFKSGKSFSVYLNSNLSAILAFTNGNTDEIYMTDSYWDISSYALVEDHSEVPVALQHKKYIIKYPAQSSWKGIYPVREHSQHALVPSTPITEIDTTVPLYDYTNEYCGYNTKLTYASDDGWIYCDGTLIYPDSDDGTGHPYTYTLSKPAYSDYNNQPPTDMVHYATNRNSMPFMYYTKHSIVAVGAYTWIYNWTTSTDIKVIMIFHPDPEHPDVNPETTKLVYGVNDFFNPFGLIRASDNYVTLQSVYLMDQFGFNCDELNDRFYIQRGNTIAMIDTASTTVGMDILPYDANSNYMTRRWCGYGLIYGTDLIVTERSFVYDSTIKKNKFVFMIYDVSTKQPVSTFELPVETTLDVHMFFGYKNHIYIQGYKDEKYYLFIYNYQTGSWCAKPNVLLNFTYAYSYAVYSRKTNQVYYDDEVLVVTAFARINRDQNGDVGCRTFAIFADDPLHPVYFETPTTDNWSPSFSKGYQHGMPRVKKFDNGKHWVLMLQGRLGISDGGTDGVNHTATYVIDLGYIKNKGYRSPSQLAENIPVPAFRMPNASYGLGGAYISASSGYQYISDYVYDNNNLWFAECCFYKDKVCVITTFGKPKLIPVEMFLPHRLTGTTRSHQAYNKRKQYSMTNHGMVLNNSANVNNE